MNVTETFNVTLTKSTNHEAEIVRTGENWYGVAWGLYVNQKKIIEALKNGAQLIITMNGEKE